jgi:hypothetical protein
VLCFAPVEFRIVRGSGWQAGFRSSVMKAVLCPKCRSWRVTGQDEHARFICQECGHVWPVALDASLPPHCEPPTIGEPSLGGMEVLKRMHQDEQWRKLIVVVLTSSA